MVALFRTWAQAGCGESRMSGFCEQRVWIPADSSNLGHSPRMPRLNAPGTHRGTGGPKRGPSPSACNLGDVAARRRSAGHRESRSRATWSHAARAWSPCPGARHDVPLVRCGRGDAGLPSPRRRSRLTSTRGVGRADAADEAAGNKPVHAERGDPALFKPRRTAEFLSTGLTAQRQRREPRRRLAGDVQDCQGFSELYMNPR